MNTYFKKVLLVTISVVLLSAAIALLIFIFNNRNSSLSNEGLSEVSLENYKNYQEIQGIKQDTVEKAEPIEVKKEESLDLNTEKDKKIETETKNIQTQKVVQEEKIISCKLKIKEGTRNDTALLSWQCTNVYNWTCDITREFYEPKNKIGAISNIKLPNGSAELYALTSSSSTTSVPTSGNRSVTIYGSNPGSNYYKMKCASIIGKKREFSEVYANYNR